MVAMGAQRLISIDEIFGDALKLLTVRPISGINGVKQRNVEICCDQQRQPHRLKILPLWLLMAPLGSLRGRLGVNPGVKVGGIIDHGRKIPVKFHRHVLGQPPLDLADSVPRSGAPVVPKPLASQISLPNRKIVVQRSVPEPLVPWDFAAGSQHMVENR